MLKNNYSVILILLMLFFLGCKKKVEVTGRFVNAETDKPLSGVPFDIVEEKETCVNCQLLGGIKRKKIASLLSDADGTFHYDFGAHRRDAKYDYLLEPRRVKYSTEKIDTVTEIIEEYYNCTNATISEYSDNRVYFSNKGANVGDIKLLPAARLNLHYHAMTGIRPFIYCRATNNPYFEIDMTPAGEGLVFTKSVPTNGSINVRVTWRDQSGTVLSNQSYTFALEPFKVGSFEVGF